jgi:predicted kinase
MLIIFGGLPGTGKTTLARALAARLGAMYLRVDTIEQSLRDSSAFAGPMDEAGYRIAYALARENLRLGRTVIADSVNPILITRRAWRAAASDAAADTVEIEVVCGDVAEHRRRVESRQPDIPGLLLPTWQDVITREYEAWDGPHITVDTATQSIAQTLQQIVSRLDGAG